MLYYFIIYNDAKNSAFDKIDTWSNIVQCKLDEIYCSACYMNIEAFFEGGEE